MFLIECLLALLLAWLGEGGLPKRPESDAAR